MPCRYTFEPLDAPPIDCRRSRRRPRLDRARPHCVRRAAAPELARRRSVQPRRRVRGAARRTALCCGRGSRPNRCRADPATPGGMSGGDVTIGYEIATDDGHAQCRAARRSDCRAGLRLFGASRRRRPAARPALLVSLQERRCGEPGRAAPSPCRRRARRSIGCASASSPAPITSTAISPPTAISTDENPEFVLFLGDYIYEYIEENRPTVRRH